MDIQPLTYKTLSTDRNIGMSLSARRTSDRFGYLHMTTIERTTHEQYALRYYNHDLLVWDKNGTVTLSWFDYQSPSCKMRINKALPREVGTLIYEFGEWVFVSPKGQKYLAKRGMRITATGKVYGASAEKYQNLRREHAKMVAKNKPAFLASRREQARLRYWTWERDATLKRGRAARATPKDHTRTLTIAKIMAEPNTTIRMAMVNTYGIDRFMRESNAQTIHSEAGYDLIRVRVVREGEEVRSNGWRQPVTTIQALKMTCPSTGQVYIETVPPTVRTVPAALDWRYDTSNYLGRVGQAT